jgi:hypothetical protein
LDRDIEVALGELKGGNYSLVVVKDGRMIAGKTGRGIAPLLQLVNEASDMLKGAVLADKVVGRAAALLVANKSLKLVYSPVMSHGALQVLDSYQVPYAYGTLVSFILRRDGNGQCPLETRVEGQTDADIGREIIDQFVNELP